MTTVSDKLPPTPSDKCGTKTGWRSHSLRNQNPCDECRNVLAKAHKKSSRFGKFKRESLTHKQRWSEITITHVAPKSVK